METYESAYEYITSTDDLKIQMGRIRSLIDAYTNSLITSATSGHLTEYTLDDGQSKIKSVLRSPKELADSIAGLEKLYLVYEVRVNKQKNGSVLRLVDSKNLNSFNNNCF